MTMSSVPMPTPSTLPRPAEPVARPSLDVQYSRARNYSRPFPPFLPENAQSSITPFPSTSTTSVNTMGTQRRMPSVDALSTLSVIRAGGQRRQASYQDYKSHHNDAYESVQDLLDQFPTVPYSSVPLRRTVSLGGNALLTSVANANAARPDHKKSLSDPNGDSRKRRKSFGKALLSLFTRETRKSSALASPDNSPATTTPSSSLPTPSDDVSRMRTWTLLGGLTPSPKKRAPPPLSTRQSYEVESEAYDPPSPLDSGALADHEYLNPVTWARGKTVSITADGLTRKASVLRLDTNTMLLRVQPVVGSRSEEPQYMVEGMPACRRCDAIFGIDGIPTCGCGDFSDDDASAETGELADDEASPDSDVLALPE